MSKIVELKNAVEQLEVDLAELCAANNELSKWHAYDLRRRDGSGRQDALHEQDGREAQDRVWNAERKVDSQKALISSLLSAV